LIFQEERCRVEFEYFLTMGVCSIFFLKRQRRKSQKWLLGFFLIPSWVEGSSSCSYEEPSVSVHPAQVGLEAGYQASEGSSTFRMIDTNFFLKKEHGLHVFEEDLVYQYIKTNHRSVTANRLFLKSDYSRYLSSKFWIFGLFSYEHAPLKGLVADAHVGAGIKRDFLRNRVWKSNFGLAFLKRDEWSTNLSYRDDLVLSFRFLLSIHWKIAEFGWTQYYRQSLKGYREGVLTDFFFIFHPEDALSVKIGYSYSYYANPFNRSAPAVDTMEYVRIVYKN